MNTPHKKNFSGVLATPRKITRGQLLAASLIAAEGPSEQDIRDQLYQASNNELEEKIDALATHYGVAFPVNADPVQQSMAYRNLLIALASDLVPGFMEPVKKGRPSKWQPLAGMFLVLDFEHYIDESQPSKGIAYAASLCAKKSHWKKYVGNNDDVADALRKAYSMLKMKEKELFPGDALDRWRRASLSQNEFDEHVSKVLEYELKRQNGEK